MPVTSLLCNLNWYARQVVVIHQGYVPSAPITTCPLHYQNMRDLQVRKRAS